MLFAQSVSLGVSNCAVLSALRLVARHSKRVDSREGGDRADLVTRN